MDATLLLTITIVAVAFIFSFVNGFHDASNAISTIVATRVLTPLKAVAWSAFFNMAAIFVFDTGVAKTVGSGMVDVNFVTPYVVLAGLLAAILWDLTTWWLKLPTSSSHSLVAGYAGAAVLHVTLVDSMANSFDVIIASGWTKVIIFIVVAPTVGFILSYLLMIAVMWLFRNVKTATTDVIFGKLQLFSSALLSLNHGGNDAQKTAGIVVSALMAAGYIAEFHVPFWVLLCAYISMSLGTLAGGWRLVQTMGFRLTKLKRHSGFCAETGGALAILMATLLKLPISTTQAITGAVLGAGSAQRVRAVRWRVAKRVLTAWILTIPCSAAVGASVMALMHWLIIQ
jgi:inorganic phosphate transporter, PiT family